MLTHDVLDESFELACFHNRLWDRWLLLAYWDEWKDLCYITLNRFYAYLELDRIYRDDLSTDPSTHSFDYDHEPDTDDGWGEL